MSTKVNIKPENIPSNQTAKVAIYSFKYIPIGSLSIMACMRCPSIFRYKNRNNTNVEVPMKEEDTPIVSALK